ncbi:MAG: ABC transporter substrate-binding protein [Pseudomonadota bacterium]
MIKKLLLFLSLISLIFLVACNSQPKKDPNLLIVGTSGDMPPFNFYDQNNKLVGFDIDISNEIAKRLNKKIEFQSVGFSRLIPSLNSGKVDVVVSALDNLEEMKDIVSYSEPYMYEITFFVVKNNLEIPLDDIFEVHGSEMKIGVNNGTTASRYLREQGLDNNLSIYPSRTDLYLALNTDKVIGILADEDEWIYINNKLDELNKNPNVNYPLLKKVGINPVYDHYMSIAVDKNNNELLEKINVIIKEMKEDGTLSKIGNEWLNREPFPRYATSEEESK